MKKVILLTCLVLATAFLVVCKHENSPPVIDDVIADPDSLGLGDTTTLSATVHDDNDDTITLMWDCIYGTFISPDSQSVMWVSPDSQGFYYLTVVAQDEHFATDTDSVEVKVVSN